MFTMRRIGAALVAATSLGALLGVVMVTQGQAGAAGPHGVNTCLYPFVWRDAGPNDEVCVPEDRRAAVAFENFLHGNLVEPNGGPYGPNTCRPGWVWRDAFAGDQTCVGPESRDLAAEENRLHSQRTALPTFDVTNVKIDYDDVYGHADLHLAPSGAYTFKLHLDNSNATAATTDTACAVKLLTGGVFVFQATGTVKGQLALLSSSKKDWFNEGRDTRIAERWAEIPPSRTVVCRMRTNSNIFDVTSALLRQIDAPDSWPVVRAVS
jgi:hypothetical protein